VKEGESSIVWLFGNLHSVDRDPASLQVNHVARLRAHHLSDRLGSRRTDVTAMIFWLKAKAGWQDADAIGGVNVNAGTDGESLQTAEEAKARTERQRALLRLLTPEVAWGHVAYKSRPVIRCDGPDRKRRYAPGAKISASAQQNSFARI
jgi:hypothetical protein